MFSWHNPWREELRKLWEPLPLHRQPALRRSRLPEALFDLDLPCCSEASDCLFFIQNAAKGGWQIWKSDGWLHVWRPDAPLPEGWWTESAAGEAACLRHLLSCHSASGDATLEIIRLLKAREQGAEAWEATCGELHREFSLRLRHHLPLPAIPLPVMPIIKEGENRHVD